MNILERLANEAKKKKDELLNRSPAAPVQAPRPTQFSPLAQQRIMARDPQGGAAKIARGPVLPKSVAPPKQENIIQKSIGGFKEGAPTLGLAAKRVAIGVGQDFSGAYDLASKGTGTNRVSKFLDTQAVATDREAARRNVTASYQQTQAPLALSALATPGLGYVGAAAKTVKVASTMPKVVKAVNTASKAANAVNKTKVVQKAVKPVTRAMNKLDNGNFAQRVTGTVIRGGLHPASLVNTATGTVFDLGAESGKGRDISRRDVATSIAMNAGASAALPAIGRVGQEAVTQAVPAAKAVNKAVQAANTKKGTVANYDSHINDLKRQKAQLEARIDRSVKTDPNWRGIETTQRHIDQLDGEIARTIDNKPKLTLKDKVLAPNVGLSMKAVHSPDLSPQQNKVIEEYATFLKDMGQGNGVDITPDGRRVSNNVRDADVKGKQLNNAYWFDKARKDLETGKADSYAVEEYKALSNKEESLELPEGWDAIGAPTTKPKAQSPATAPAGQPPAGKRTGGVSLPIKVSQKGAEKGIDVSKVEINGRQQTKTNLTTGKEKRFTLDANGEMQPDTNGAYKIFTDDDGRVTSFRVGDEVFDAKDLGGLDDVNGYGSVFATMRRNVERAFPKSSEKVSRFLIDHQQAQATKLIDRRVQLNKGLQEQADNLGISFGIGRHKAKKVSADIQNYGEGKMDRAQLNEKYGVEYAGKIVEADKWFRKQYDGLLDEMNETLVKYGYDPVPKRKDYYTHFSEPTLWEKFGLKMQEVSDLASPTMQDADPTKGRGSISNKLAGQSEYLQPNKQFNRFALRRQGDQRTADAFQSFERYLNPTLSNIYMTPSITRARVLSKAIAENADIDGKDINKTVVQLREWANGLAGKSNRFGDRQLADTMNGQRVLKVMQWMQKKAGANTIVGNLSTAALQPIVSSQAIGRFGLKNWLLAAAQEMSTAHAGNAAIRQSQFMRRRYADLTAVTAGKFDRSAKVANKPLEVVEETSARIVWNAAHNKALSSGLKGKEAIRMADIETEKTLGGRSIGERPELMNSRTAGPFTMYQLEVNNFWQQFGKEMTKGQAAKTLVAAYVFNLGLQQLTGRDVGFNPIDAAIDGYQEATSDDETGEKVKKIAQRAAGEVVDNTPFVAPVMGSILGDKRVKKIFGDESNVGRFGVSSPISTLIDNPYYLALPFGGAQAKKTFEGVKAYADGKITDKTGKTLAEIPQTAGNAVKSALFGKSAVPEVKNYYDGIGKPKTGQGTTTGKLTDDKKAMATAFGKDFAALKNDEERKEWAAQSADNRAIYDNYQAMKTGTKQSTTLRPSGMSADSTKTLDRFDRLTTKAKDKILAREKDAEYKLALAKYEQDKLEGNLSTTEDIRRQQELLKAQVGAEFDKEIRDLYGLNKTQLYKYLNTHPDGNRLAQQLVAYGDSLEANEVDDNKLRDSKGRVAIRPADKKSGSGRSGANKYGLKPSDFVTPYTNLIKSSTTGASLARSAGLAKKKA